jgi:hypothetical protein
MITVLKTGSYKLIETKWANKILYLDEKAYAWIDSKRIGELLVATHREHDAYFVLSRGAYILYDVKDEDNLTDLQHLELECGTYAWQGYLLLTGLPAGTKKKCRIIPTEQLITGAPYFFPKDTKRSKILNFSVAASKR